MAKRSSRRRPAKDLRATEPAGAASSGAPSRGRSLSTGAFGLALAAVVVVGYLPSIDGGMQFDDVSSIEQNIAIKDVGRFLRHDFWAGLGHGSRVMADLTFALNYAQARLEPRPYHVTSVLCHLAAAFVVFLLGRRLLQLGGWPRPEWPALAATALWALHPLNSQAVSYIVQRAEVLASIGYALAVLLVLEAAARGRTPTGVACYAGALLAALLGFESKPITLSLPVALLAALWLANLPALARPWLARAGLAAPFGLIALRYGTRIIAASAGTKDMGFGIPGMQSVSYPATQVRVVLGYLRQLSWPDGLSLDHDIAPSHGWLEPTALGSGAVLVGLASLVAYLAWRTSRSDPSTPLARASRLALFGLAWWFILLSPTSSVVPLADLMMDHRPYLASWGLLLGATALASALLQRWLGARASRAGLALALALSAALTLALHARNQVWSSPLATWSDVVQKAPNRWRGWQNLAQQVWAAGDHGKALDMDRRALGLALSPEDRVATLLNMGSDLLGVGEIDQSVGALLAAERLSGDNPYVENNLATALAAAGRWDEAEARARRAIALAPTMAPGYTALGQVLGERGDYGGALQLFERAADLDANGLTPRQNAATMFERLGRPGEACVAWRRYGEVRAGIDKATADRRRARLRCDRLEPGTP